MFSGDNPDGQRDFTLTVAYIFAVRDFDVHDACRYKDQYFQYDGFVYDLRSIRFCYLVTMTVLCIFPPNQVV